MNERLMTFAELSDDRYILENGLAEFPYGNEGMLVGKVIGTLWWPGKHIRQIQLAECSSWSTTARRWTRHDGHILNFDMNLFEYFCGPYQTETGDVFFLQSAGPNTFFYVRFFDNENKRKEPVGLGPLYEVHRRIMDPEPPSRRVS